MSDHPIIRATLDDDGRPTGFYPEPTWQKDKVPSDAIEIPHWAYVELLRLNGRSKWDGERVIECEPRLWTEADFSKRLPAYWQALGCFIDKFSKIERLLFVKLIVEAEISIPVAKAIFTDARINKAKDTINRIRRAKGLEQHPLLDRAFDQLGRINRTRNDIVHYGVNFDQAGKIFVSKELWAHTPDKAGTYEISVDVLMAMVVDLSTIEACIAAQTLTGIAPSEFIAAGFGSAAQAPWQYKPPPLSAPDGKPPHHKKEQQRPRGASQASPKQQKLSSAQKRSQARTPREKGETP